MKSPFLYAGGKYYARKYIDKHLKDSVVYCEAYVGGGSIFFHKDKSKVNILNDLDSELINTYKIIRDYPSEMINTLSNFEFPSLEVYKYYKNEYRASNEIEEACRWYYLNRTTYGGITYKPNMSYSYHKGISMKPERWLEIISLASDKLQGVELRCQDGVDCINSLPNETFVFIDPPYCISNQKTLYKHSFELSEHYVLADCVKENKDRLHILITLDDCEIARDLYSFMNNIYDESWYYTIDNKLKLECNTVNKDGIQRGKSKLGNELIICNF